MNAPAKTCETCGRTITWRKKWERNWDEVRYCSKRCRSTKPTAIDRALQDEIVTLLDQRAGGATICPSEAARAVHARQPGADAEGWRALMEPARSAARRLVADDQVVITQKGHVVDPSTARGPIRIRKARP